MSSNLLYSFSIYLQNSMNQWCHYDTSSMSIQWDTILTLFGSDLEDAMKNVPDEYQGWRIVNVDYPIGYQNFPIVSISDNAVGEFAMLNIC